MHRLAYPIVRALAAPQTDLSQRKDIIISAKSIQKFDNEFDVIVAGSGAAGCVSALSARWHGGSVCVLEKSATKFGGTTAKTGGIFWIPNNHLINKPDPKDEFLKYVAKESFPDQYKAYDDYLGLEEKQYKWLELFYETGRHMVTTLAKKGAFPRVVQFNDTHGHPMYDYKYHRHTDVDNVVPAGRSLAVGYTPVMEKLLRSASWVVGLCEPVLIKIASFAPSVKDLVVRRQLLTVSKGSYMIRCLKKQMIKDGIVIKMGASVDGIVVDENRNVVGVRFQSADDTQYMKARKGVIFATGGFSQNEKLLQENLPGPVYGTCAGSENQGDFLNLAKALGCKIGKLDCVWGASTLLEERLQQGWEKESAMISVPGDSAFIVNRTGLRVLDEKCTFQERLAVHWKKDVGQNSFPNKFLFLIADERCARLHGSDLCELPGNLNSPIYIKANNLDELADKIQARLNKLEPHIGKFNLESNFKDNLKSTLKTFNKYAENDLDEEFGRGERPSQQQWTREIVPRRKKKRDPNVNSTMHPLDTTGSFFAVILAPAVVDTKGGPVINVEGQVLNKKECPIGGLYAAGNAANPISGRAYWSGGASLASAMVTGWIAGQSVAARGKGK